MASSDFVPILRKTEPLQRPQQPDNAGLFFQALAARQQEQQQQLQAQKVLSDTVLSMGSLMEKRRQANLEAAQGKALLDLRNRALEEEQRQAQAAEAFKDRVINTQPEQIDLGGRPALKTLRTTGYDIKFMPQPFGGTGNPNMILSPADAAKLGVPYGTTRGQAATMGIMPLSDKASQDVQAGSNALSQLANFEKAIGDVGLADDVLTANVVGLQKMAKSKAEGTPEAFYAAQVNNISNLVRDLGERGVLTDNDIGRAKASLPSFRDTKDSAMKKLNTMRDLIEENQFNVRNGYRRENIKADKLSNWMARKRAAGISDAYILEMAKFKLGRGMLIDDRNK